MSIQVQIYCLYGVIVILLNVILCFALLIRRILKSDLLFRKTVIDAFNEIFYNLEGKIGVRANPSKDQTSAKFHQVPSTKMEFYEVNPHGHQMVKTICKNCKKVFETSKPLAQTESALCTPCFKEAYLKKLSEW